MDLNLLLVLDALHRRRSVAAASDELAISASACSHALARLRQAFDDELFMRRGSGMQPTPKAAELGEAAAEALRLLTDKLGDAERFSPKTSTQSSSSRPPTSPPSRCCPPSFRASSESRPASVSK